MASKCLLFIAGLLAVVSSMELKNGAYEDLVIKVQENVPEKDCRNIIENLEVSFEFILLVSFDEMKRFAKGVDDWRTINSNLDIFKSKFS